MAAKIFLDCECVGEAKRIAEDVFQEDDFISVALSRRPDHQAPTP